jgi:SAM-dependent methyltransferase
MRVMSDSPSARHVTACRACGGALAIPFCDLGDQPLANSFVDPAQQDRPDPRFPLSVRVCAACHLAQLDHIVDAEDIFSDYAYFSSYSTSWLAHAAAFCTAATQRLRLDRTSFVVEVASNDGYLLRNFVAAGIPCLGIEPAENVAAVARAAGIPTETRFFGQAAADEIVDRRGHADLVVANNVLAHVPDINDFVAGLARLVGPRGVVSIEAPHLVRLIAEVQFDTIYHEHYAYWSLHAMDHVLRAHGLVVIAVERLPTHGGSLRVFAAAPDRRDAAAEAVAEVRSEEARLGIAGSALYEGFEDRVRAVIDGFRDYLRSAKGSGRSVAAYGAAAKGNTFLNACGATVADIAMVADKNPVKQGRLLPGSRIPIISPEALVAARPDDVVILPWNLAHEISRELSAIPAGGGRLVTAVPSVKVVA